MLSKCYEWYRVVDASPTSDTIDRRRAAAESLVEVLSGDDDDVLLGGAAGIASGFEVSATQETTVVQRIVESIRAHESAFPSDLSENALELRVCASVAMGELMQTDSRNGWLAAGAIRSGLGARRRSSRRYLQDMLDGLTELADERLWESAAILRRRDGHAFAPIGAVDLTNVNTAVPALVAGLKQSIERMERERRMDREETNILWWVFSGDSTTTRGPRADLPASDAAICAAVEMSRLCQVPAHPNVEGMIRIVSGRGRTEEERKPVTLKELGSSLDLELLEELLHEDPARALGHDYPSLAPVLWVCDQLLETKGAARWGAALKRVAGVSADIERTPAEWSVQLLRELLVSRSANE